MRLTTPQRAALASHLLQRFRCVTRAKGDAVEMRAVASAFGVARLLGAQLPAEGDFMDRYWTTLGPVIYTPRTAGQLSEHLRVLSHELTHAVQFWREGPAFALRYAGRRGRAELEAEAERGAIEVWCLLTGELPTSREQLDITRHGYALGNGPGPHDDHADLTRDLLEVAVTSVRAGLLSTDVGLAVAGWLAQHAPDARVGVPA